MAERVVPGAVAATLVVLLAFHSGGYFASEWGLVALLFLLLAVAALIVADSVIVSVRRSVFVLALLGLALWQLLSVLWSTGAGLPVQETERTLMYLSAVAALFLCLTRRRADSLLEGVAAGVTVVAVYALGTRLAPGLLGGAYDPSSGYQLAKPIGYANALGLLLVFGIALSVGIALHARLPLAAVAGAALVPQVAAVYFTFSRGAFVALGIALAVIAALERERLRTIGTLGALFAAPALGARLAARSPALTAPGATLRTAQFQGHRLVWEFVVLCVATAAMTAGARSIGGRVRPSRTVARAIALAAAVAIIAALAAGVVRAGGLTSVADDVAHSFTAPQPPSIEQGPAGRLLSVQGNGRADYWAVAARMVGRHPLLGEGAGSFALGWARDRPIAGDESRDAHNLYLETLAELGPVGIALLLLVLVVPLTTLRRRQEDFLVPAAAGAYVAFLLHAALDWDWEIPLLTLLPFAFAATLLLPASGGSGVKLTARTRSLGLVAATIMLACALVAHVGNRAAADAAQALARGDTRTAGSDARRARTWMPWSYQPWQLLGESQFADGARGAADSFRHAKSLDAGQWSVWFDLSLAEHGRASASAMGRARDLNPLGIGRSLRLTTQQRHP